MITMMYSSTGDAQEEKMPSLPIFIDTSLTLHVFASLGKREER
jgi:hypothetical protein